MDNFTLHYKEWGFIFYPLYKIRDNLWGESKSVWRSIFANFTFIFLFFLTFTRALNVPRGLSSCLLHIWCVIKTTLQKLRKSSYHWNFHLQHISAVLCWLHYVCVLLSRWLALFCGFKWFWEEEMDVRQIVQQLLILWFLCGALHKCQCSASKTEENQTQTEVNGTFTGNVVLGN